MVPLSMTSGSLGHSIAIGTEAVGLLFMSEHALLIVTNSNQIGGTKLANCSANDEQFCVLKPPAAGYCMQEATVNLLRHVAACKCCCRQHHWDRIRSGKLFLCVTAAMYQDTARQCKQ